MPGCVTTTIGFCCFLKIKNSFNVDSEDQIGPSVCKVSTLLPGPLNPQLTLPAFFLSETSSHYPKAVLELSLSSMLTSSSGIRHHSWPYLHDKSIHPFSEPR